MLLEVFYSRENNIYHIAHAAAKCRLYTLTFIPPMEQKELAKLDAKDAKERKALTRSGLYPRAALKPVRIAEGPRPLHAEGIRCMSREECLQHLGDATDGIVNWPQPTEGPMPNDSGEYRRTTLGEAYGLHLGPRDRAAHRDTIPLRPRSRELIYLHIFSGMRREGDLQYHLEYVGAGKGATVIVISLDIAIDAEKCDLRNPEVLTEWRLHIRAGRIAGMGGEPLVRHGRLPASLRTEGPPGLSRSVEQKSHGV